MNILNKQKGLAAIELTLVLPFLLLIIFATFEFSRMLYQYNALNKYARDAARYLIVHAAEGTTKTINLDLAKSDTLKLFINGDLNTSTELLPGLSSTALTQLTLSSSGKFVTIKVIYYWKPVLFSVLPSFASNKTINMSFPLEVNYSMRALGV